MTEHISPLRLRMIEDMTIRNLSRWTCAGGSFPVSRAASPVAARPWICR